MSHECEHCGDEFETLTRLRLHDCSPTAGAGGESDVSADPHGTGALSDSVAAGRPDAVAVTRLEDLLADVQDGETDALYQALATYESELTAARDADDTDRYQGIRRGYRERLIAALDGAVQREGWPVLDAALDAYHPAADEDLPHVTTILQNVTGRYLIRTRLADGVDAIPVAALEYFEAVRTDVGEYQDFILEGLHPYGWGIGHPAVDVAGTIHDHAATEIFSTNPMLEHAFYADQEAAVALLERLVHDESVDAEIANRPGETLSAARFLLDAPAGAASDRFWPTTPRDWDWRDEFDFEFELREDVERRIRDLVAAANVDDALPDEWEITDLTL